MSSVRDSRPQQRRHAWVDDSRQGASSGVGCDKVASADCQLSLRPGAATKTPDKGASMTFRKFYPKGVNKVEPSTSDGNTRQSGPRVSDSKLTDMPPKSTSTNKDCCFDPVVPGAKTSAGKDLKETPKSWRGRALQMLQGSRGPTKSKTSWLSRNPNHSGQSSSRPSPAMGLATTDGAVSVPTRQIRTSTSPKPDNRPVALPDPMTAFRRGTSIADAAYDQVLVRAGVLRPAP